MCLELFYVFKYKDFTILSLELVLFCGSKAELKGKGWRQANSSSPPGDQTLQVET